VATNDTQRAAVFSLQLRRAHQQLRDELARIREALGGDEHAVTGLQVHCLAFCSALATPHRGEGQASRSIRCPETVAGNAPRTQLHVMPVSVSVSAG